MRSMPVVGGGFSPYGSNGAGRSVMVNNQHRGVLDGFQQVSQIPSSQAYHALAISQALNSLRSSSTPVNSFAKNGSPTRRCIIFSGCEIEYELINYYGGPQTDVHIVDIRFTGSGAEIGNRAALWPVSHKVREGWARSDKKPEARLAPMPTASGSKGQPLKIGINGYCDGINHAARILPEHIARGEQSTLQELQATGYQMFYVPVDESAVKAGWTYIRDMVCSPGGKVNVQASRILAAHMKEAHDQGLYVEWTTHRGGSKVLTEAMKHLSNNRINVEGKQKIFLSDHTSSHFDADRSRRAIGMNVQSGKWYNSAPGLVQIAGGKNFGLASAACSINDLIHHTDPSEKVGKSVTTSIKIGVGTYGLAKTVPALGELAASSSLTPAFGEMLLKAAGFATLSLVGASIPSLNEDYHKSSLDKVSRQINKLSNKP